MSLADWSALVVSVLASVALAPVALASGTDPVAAASGIDFVVPFAGIDPAALATGAGPAITAPRVGSALAQTGPFGWGQSLQKLVREATGVVGLAIIGVYSFLVAVALPFPGEIVLAAKLQLPVPDWAEIGLLVLVSSVFKSAGSVVAFWVGGRSAGPITRWLKRSGVDLVKYGERATVKAARKWGYVGLTAVLSVPFFPDTITIYAFTALEESYVRFAAATFVGSALRLLLVATVLAPFFDLT